MTKKFKLISYEESKQLDEEINKKFQEWNDVLEQYGCKLAKTLLMNDEILEPMPLLYSADIAYKIKDNGLVSSKIKDRIGGL